MKSSPILFMRLSNIFFLCIFFLIPTTLLADIPPIINYQGYLADKNGIPVTGPLQMTFSIYDVPEGGIPLWTETQNVVVSKGLYSAILGSSNALTADITASSLLHFGVKVGDDAEMVPRQRLASSVFSLKAAIAENVVDHSITAAKIGEACSEGQVLVMKSSGIWGCGAAAIPDGTITGIQILSGSITGQNIADGSISDTKISGIISDSHLSSNIARASSPNTFSGGQSIVTNAYTKGLLISGSAGQAMNLQEWQIDGEVKASINASGVFSGDGSGLTNLNVPPPANITTSASATAIGVNALNSAGTQTGNTAVGVDTLKSNATGTYNTAIGYRTMYNSNSGGQNTAVGFGAMGNANGSYNVALGYNTLNSTTGSDNIAIGQGAGSGVATGSRNIYIGTYVGPATAEETGTIRIGNINYHNQTFIAGGSVYLGSSAGPSTAGESATIRIGSSGFHNQAFIAGVLYKPLTGALPVYIDTDGKLGTQVSSLQYKEQVNDMGDVSDGLMKLRPVTFYYKPEYSPGPRILQYGLIAEEVAMVSPNLVHYDQATGEPQSVYYHNINVMLLGEVQKQRREIEDLKASISHLQSIVNRLAGN